MPVPSIYVIAADLEKGRPVEAHLYMVEPDGTFELLAKEPDAAFQHIETDPFGRALISSWFVDPTTGRESRHILRWTGSELERFTDRMSWTVRGFVFLPDGSLIVGDGSGRLHRWDEAGGMASGGGDPLSPR